MVLENIISDEILKKAGRKLFGTTTRITVATKQMLLGKTQGDKGERNGVEGPTVTGYSLEGIMNNTQCPKCGATVSSTVSKCPNCGTPVTTENTTEEHPTKLSYAECTLEKTPYDVYDPDEFKKH